jgi:hypothetical protein
VLAHAGGRRRVLSPAALCGWPPMPQCALVPHRSMLALRSPSCYRLPCACLVTRHTPCISRCFSDTNRCSVGIRGFQSARAGPMGGYKVLCSHGLRCRAAWMLMQCCVCTTGNVMLCACNAVPRSQARHPNVACQNAKRHSVQFISA